MMNNCQNSTSWLIGLAIAFFGLPDIPVHSAPPVMRDAATHEQLAQRYRSAEQTDPMKKMPPSQGEDPAKNLPQDLLSQSDFICFGGVATLVPKRAILTVPKALEDRTRLEAQFRIVGWLEFYSLNRAWITTVEVTRQQAEGNVALSEDTYASLKESTTLVVATFKGGPISILPLKESPTDAAPSAEIQKP